MIVLLAENRWEAGVEIFNCILIAQHQKPVIRRIGIKIQDGKIELFSTIIVTHAGENIIEFTHLHSYSSFFISTPSVVILTGLINPSLSKNSLSTQTTR
jgi:hypothetical protein